MKDHSAVPLFKFIFAVFKIFGVATVTIDRNYHFSSSKLGIAYNVLLIIVVCIVCTYFGVNLSYFLDFADRDQLEKITDTIQTVFNIGTSLFILIVHCIRQDQVINIANDLRQCIDTSYTLVCKNTYKGKLNNLVKAIKTIIFFNAMIASICVIATPTATNELLLYFVSMTICNFIINAVIMQYTIILTIICHLFDVLNSSLAESTNYNIEHLKISFMQKYGLQMKLNKLSQCRDFFTSLSKLSKEISQFMEAIMLVCITNVFLTLIIYGYYVMKPVVVGNNVIAPTILIRSSMQLVSSIVSTVLLVKASSSAVNQSKRTGEIVNETLHKEGFICHPDVEKLMNLFSNYLLHVNIRFVVCNLFPLDESLLMSIAGSITTNLVILLQFKQGQI